ncbi:hypothetical protein BGX23_003832 [Mortierella sp. AD031]|nr:hypothetical protein BGX23_003832 [Mortierella sp. AD031]
MDDQVPESIFEYRTRACWMLVIRNPGLQSLHWSSGVMTDLDPKSEEFMIKCLSRLKELRELEVKGQLQEVVITRLGPQFLPQVSTLHYSNNSGLSTEYLRATTNTTVSSLRIDHCVDTSHFRALLQAFPMLEDLVIYGVDRVLPSKDAVIVHHNLKRLSIGIIYGLLKVRVQFPLLDTIHLHLIEDGFRRLESLLNQFPRLEHLIADNFMMAGGLRTYGSDEDVDKAKDKDSIEWPLKTLDILRSRDSLPTISGLLGRMPHLVRLELGWIPAEAVRVISQTCSSTLEHVRFSLHKPCFEEMNQLLISCSKLKTCRGLGLVVRAEDMIREPFWPCLGLEELDLVVHGVPRLTRQQELFLETRKAQEPRYDDYHDGDRSDDEDKEYAKIVEKQQESELVKAKVDQQLARLIHLRHLDLTFKYSTDDD